MASLDTGPLNRYDRLTSENTRALGDDPSDEMRERRIEPELEVFNNGHLNGVRSPRTPRPRRPRHTPLSSSSGDTDASPSQNFFEQSGPD
ncbi:hypothetical protein [Halogeometricum sp. CBA1124]|uniref:hypothetical protein n=1 Tax=Halogeometricum sp. CBA1124 TaxID=2668071 RepID=UPI0031B6B8DC